MDFYPQSCCLTNYSSYYLSWTKNYCYYLKSSKKNSTNCSKMNYYLKNYYYSNLTKNSNWMMKNYLSSRKMMNSRTKNYCYYLKSSKKNSKNCSSLSLTTSCSRKNLKKNYLSYSNLRTSYYLSWTKN